MLKVFKTCPVCGKTFVKTGCRQTFCSPHCRRKSYLSEHKESILKKNRIYDLRYRTKKKACRKPRESIPCKTCGKLFVPRSDCNRFCSKRCRKRFYATKMRKIHEANCAEKTCQWCGKAFIPNVGQRKYCSDACLIKATMKKFQAYRELSHYEFMERIYSDPVLYALHRAKERERYVRTRKSRGIKREYRPRPQTRFPDCLSKNEEALSSTSVLIANNLTDEQLFENRSFSIEIAKDRFGKRDRFGDIR